MNSDQPLGFWLRFGEEWRLFELDRLELDRISGFGGSITAQIILTDPDARLEPLPLLAQRFDADGLRHRTKTFAIEAEVRLTACEAKVRGTSYRAVQDLDDPVAKACKRLVSVEYDVR
jgi:hypothetical protein